jgi:primosomal protein N' (replication factor Y)
MLNLGVGTQRVEELLRTMHPKTTILRMDLDTTTKKGSHHRILDQFKNRDASILLGTQMITKGLDFENVTVVGVISADTTLLLPDFRSSERTFQLLTQVAGRAGRKDKLGRVVVQTFNPDRAPILFAQKHDFKGFYHEEICHRQELMYPPFGRLIVIVFKHADLKKVVEHCQVFSDILRALMRQKHWATNHAMVLGPTSSPIGKIRNQFRWQILIKINKTFDRNGQLFRSLLKETDRLYKERITDEAVHHTIEIDPNHLL